MHPVLAALEREGKISADDLEFLTIHGRDYQGRPLPYGIERRRPGTCLDTADDLAAAGEGRFVRGFALRPGGRLALPHAWVSADGRTVIDATWTDQRSCSYWGLPRRHERRVAGMIKVKSPYSIPLF